MERPILILLMLVRDSLAEGHKPGYYNAGICGEIVNLHGFGKITYHELGKVSEYIHRNEPTTKFRSKFWVEHTLSSHWWPRMKDNEQFRKVRVDFLTELIREISPSRPSVFRKIYNFFRK